jgi:hypothetical protein
MRTTLDIDADVLQAVKELAQSSHSTAGAVLSGLARQALTRKAQVAESAPPYSRNGIPLLPHRPGELITHEHTQALEAGED